MQNQNSQKRHQNLLSNKLTSVIGFPIEIVEVPEEILNITLTSEKNYLIMQKLSSDFQVRKIVVPRSQAPNMLKIVDTQEFQVAAIELENFFTEKYNTGTYFK